MAEVVELVVATSPLQRYLTRAEATVSAPEHSEKRSCDALSSNTQLNLKVQPGRCSALEASSPIWEAPAPKHSDALARSSSPTVLQLTPAGKKEYSASVALLTEVAELESEVDVVLVTEALVAEALVVVLVALPGQIYRRESDGEVPAPDAAPCSTAPDEASKTQLNCATLDRMGKAAAPSRPTAAAAAPKHSRVPETSARPAPWHVSPGGSSA